MTWRIYILNVLLAFDELVNCIVKGRPGMTLSARAATARRSGRLWGCWLCTYFLDKLEANHCDDAMTGDIARAGAVVQDVEGVER